MHLFSAGLCNVKLSLHFEYLIWPEIATAFLFFCPWAFLLVHRWIKDCLRDAIPRSGSVKFFVVHFEESSFTFGPSVLGANVYQM